MVNTTNETVDTVAESAGSELAPVKRKSKKAKRFIILGVVLVLVAVGIFAVMQLRGRPAAASTGTGYTLATAAKGNIIVSMSGSGTLTPADSYTLKGVVAGEILEAPFEEGDVLEEGAVMYRIDPSDAEEAIRDAEEELESAQSTLDKNIRDYNDLLKDQADHNKERAEQLAELKLYSTEKGQIVDLLVEEGDTVTPTSPVATIRDSSSLLLTLPFLETDVQSMSVGDTATITLPEYMTSVNGKVDSISRVNNIGAQGAQVRNVTISISNPGVLAAGASAIASVGDISCYESGMLQYKTETTIKAKASGTVESLKVSEGDYVNKGQLLMVLEATDDKSNYEKQLEQALDAIENAERTVSKRQESLDAAIEKLEDYTITAPINGTVVDKKIKAGDTISAMTDLAVLYDLSSLTFTMNVDELDISQIEVGQTAIITADAVEGRIYTGEVTRISVQGTTSNNVTSYPVTVKITEIDGLLPFMNVSVIINVTERMGVLTLPNSAVQRGNRVLLQTDPNADPNAVVAEGANTPAGFTYVEVKVGETDGTSIEILDGLKEGDVVAYRRAVVPTSDMNMNQMGGMYYTTTDSMGGEMIVREAAPAGGMGGGRTGGVAPNMGGGGFR